MIITVIGWYGTETIGDRAILAGLISIFNKTYDTFEIKLGSLYPFFSERTRNEDYPFYKEFMQKDITIDIFDSRNPNELVNAMKKSDLVTMGGGPIMDFKEIFMIEYAFKKAQKIGVKTALLGCGIGPLFHKKYRRSLIHIAEHSDLIILRDNSSKKHIKAIYHEFNIPFTPDRIHTSFDPAMECALQFNALHTSTKQDYIAVNLRTFPLEYNRQNSTLGINENLEIFIGNLADTYPQREIRLIPMHYFHKGDDDRIFLNKIAFSLKKSNIRVQNEILTLKETMAIYSNAYLTIGMRFHAIVLQTITNGHNYILDYTDPEQGKTGGFLKDIDPDNFYAKRYISLQQDHITVDVIKNMNSPFEDDREQTLARLSLYIQLLKGLR